MEGVRAGCSEGSRVGVLAGRKVAKEGVGWGGVGHH